MKKMIAINLIILFLLFSCGDRGQVQVSKQENPPQVMATPTPPSTLADISGLSPSERRPEDRISGNVSALIAFGTNNRDYASTSEDNFTIQGQVIPSATRIELLLDGKSIYNKEFSGNEEPHSFTVHLTKAKGEMKEGHNEYIFRLYRGNDYLDRTFSLDVLPQSPVDLK